MGVRMRLGEGTAQDNTFHPLTCIQLNLMFAALQNAREAWQDCDSGALPRSHHCEFHCKQFLENSGEMRARVLKIQGASSPRSLTQIERWPPTGWLLLCFCQACCAAACAAVPRCLEPRPSRVRPLSQDSASQPTTLRLAAWL